MTKRKSPIRNNIDIIKNDISYIKTALAWLIGIITTTAFSVFAVAIWFGNIQNATAQNTSDLKDLKHLHYQQVGK